MQKSKLNWLMQGERNTRFFHATAVMKRRKNMVHRLKDEHGQWVEDTMRLCHMVFHFYAQLYSDEGGTSSQQVHIWFPQLLSTELHALNSPVVESEVYSAMFQMGAYKSPGPNGFSPIFYQRN